MWCNMGDMMILLNGDVLIINGVGEGVQGWGRVVKVVYIFVKYVIYDVNVRFEMFVVLEIVRVYYLIVNLFIDGRIFVVGSNMYEYYMFMGKYFMEFCVEVFLLLYFVVG